MDYSDEEQKVLEKEFAEEFAKVLEEFLEAWHNNPSCCKKWTPLQMPARLIHGLRIIYLDYGREGIDEAFTKLQDSSYWKGVGGMALPQFLDPKIFDKLIGGAYDDRKEIR